MSCAWGRESARWEALINALANVGVFGLLGCGRCAATMTVEVSVMANTTSFLAC